MESCSVVYNIYDMFLLRWYSLTSHFFVEQTTGSSKGPVWDRKLITPSRSSFIIGLNLMSSSHVIPADNWPGGSKLQTINEKWRETITWAVSECYNKYVISQKLKSLEIDLYTASRILTSSMRREPFLSLGDWKRVYDIKHWLVPCINSAQRENFDLSMF